MKVAIVNLGQIVSGDWRKPFAEGDTILVDGETITSVGAASAGMTEAADVVIDADRMTAIPGLIDSHVHITFGDCQTKRSMAIWTVVSTPSIHLAREGVAHAAAKTAIASSGTTGTIIRAVGAKPPATP